MEEQLIVIKEALVHFDRRHEEISDQQVTIKVDIHKAISNLHQKLDIKESELISQLHHLTQIKFKRLTVQRDLMETTQTKLRSCLHFMKESLKTSNPREVLMTIREVKELTNTCQPGLLEPNTEADLIFSASADLTVKCLNYGKVCATGSPDPSKCFITGKKIQATVAVGDKSTVILQTLNYHSQPCETPISSILCELVSEITGIRARGSVERRGKSQYEIGYHPTIKGQHQLHIKMEDQHIRGSPFPITIRSLEDLGKPILTIDGVEKPEGVAINSRGEVIVTSYYGHCVTVFSPSGEKLQSFGAYGASQRQFDHPSAVAVDYEDNILVVDTDNNRIQKFTSQGRFITAVGTRGNGPLQFNYPRGITCNMSNGRVYVADNWNHRIEILNSDLSYVGTFGKRGSGKGEFVNPCHIVCNSTGRVYVVDCGNDRIQVFTTEGKFLKVFGRHGEGMGELKQPWGVAVDFNGRLYVSECGNHRISVFTSEGGFCDFFCQRGESTGKVQSSSWTGGRYQWSSVYL